jgi:hypothetical protein
MWMSFRLPLRLRGAARYVEFRSPPYKKTRRLLRFVVNTLVHRFQESIGGRTYQIEVASVEPDRWRACIV